jgi:S1-C subfamily serine protease
VAGIGLGLAVPINDATRRIVGALMRDGRFRRAYLGVALGTRPLPPRFARELRQEGCVEIVEVVPDSPAAAGDLRPGDLVVALDGAAVEDASTLQRLMVSELIGEPVRLTVVRNERVLELELVARELAA